MNELIEPENYHKKLKRNRVQCLYCGDIIESKTRHNFVTCSCGKTFVDGGLDFQRIGFTGLPIKAYKNLAEYEE